MISSTVSRAIAQPAEGWVCLSCRSRKAAIPTPALVKGATVARGFRSCLTEHVRRYASTIPQSVSPEVRRGEKLPNLPARTRFAPSPTGYMHIGGLRTALFSFLLAKRTNGQFLLRIEDTDQKRLVTDAEARLCEDLQWAGLQWDEGPQVDGPFGPYRQSERNEIYQKHAHDLLEAGSAYRCFCTPQTTGSTGSKAAFVTSGCYQDCSSLSLDQAKEKSESEKHPFTVRLRQPADVHRRVYRDLIYGKIQRLKRSPSSSQGGGDDSGVDATDTILVKSDGTPTYHFANVIDDHLMQITHVIRGSEWMASTPLHYDLYTAFGWEPPAFAHVGLLVDENKAKLSKRSNTGLVLDVKGMREQEGILPEVLTNFLSLLGWSNPGRTDVLEMDELIRDFDLKFTKGNTVVRMEKLWFLQKQHVARKCERALSESSLEPVRAIVKSISDEATLAYPAGSSNLNKDQKSLEALCADILLTDSKSFQTPSEYVKRNRYFFAYDAGQIPEQSEFYDKHHLYSGDALAAFVRLILSDFDWSQPYQENAFTQGAVAKDANGNSDRPQSPTERISSRIHAAINLTIWRVICDPNILAPAFPKSGETYSHSIERESVMLPFTPKSIDVEAFARYLVTHSQAPPQGEAARAQELVHQYKEWNKALMRFVREKLSYGLPGPGVGAIMALLGYEECCRRLNAEPRKDGGW